jgi:predicted nucleotidyltransferase
LVRSFRVADLAAAVRDRLPWVDFAYLLGSAQDGRLLAGADVDVAVYLAAAALPANWERIAAVMSTVETVCPPAVCDPGILNTAGVVYRFEALKGRLLFRRQGREDKHAEFYSLTCREYEDYMASLWRARLCRSPGRRAPTSDTDERACG